jgi:hypothetical protein
MDDKEQVVQQSPCFDKNLDHKKKKKKKKRTRKNLFGMTSVVNSGNNGGRTKMSDAINQLRIRRMLRVRQRNSHNLSKSPRCVQNASFSILFLRHFCPRPSGWRKSSDDIVVRQIGAELEQRIKRTLPERGHMHSSVCFARNKPRHVAVSTSKQFHLSIDLKTKLC